MCSVHANYISVHVLQRPSLVCCYKFRLDIYQSDVSNVPMGIEILLLRCLRVSSSQNLFHVSIGLTTVTASISCWQLGIDNFYFMLLGVEIVFSIVLDYWLMQFTLCSSPKLCYTLRNAYLPHFVVTIKENVLKQ